MANENIVFHIGLQKTGSTYLQKNVFPSIKDGYFVRANKKFTFVIEDLAFNTTKPMLISSENLSARLHLSNYVDKRVSMIQKLSELFPNSKLFVFLREPSDWFESFYRQHIYQGDVSSFEEFVRGHQEIIQFEEFLQDIENMNFSQVLFLSYEQLKSNPRKVIKMIKQFIGNIDFEVDEKTLNTKSHVSFRGNGLKFLRFYNRFVYDKSNPKMIHRKRSRLRGMVSKLRLEPKVLLGKFPLKYLNNFGTDLVDPDLKQELRKQYEDEWQRILDKIDQNQREVLGDIG